MWRLAASRAYSGQDAHSAHDDRTEANLAREPDGNHGHKAYGGLAGAPLRTQLTIPAFIVMEGSPFRRTSTETGIASGNATDKRKIIPDRSCECGLTVNRKV